jgi:hypothetical protein
MAHRLAGAPTQADHALSTEADSGTTRTTRMTQRSQDPTPERTLQPLAAILAWVLPGLGHWWLGQRVRAIRVFAGMAVLILGGLLIGGVDSVDSKNDPLWFYAQVCCGPVVLGIDALNQSVVKNMPEDDQLAWRSLGHVNSIGTLFIGLAGLMNVVVILEALYPRQEQRRERRSRTEDA